MKFTELKHSFAEPVAIDIMYHLEPIAGSDVKEILFELHQLVSAKEISVVVVTNRVRVSLSPQER